MKTIRALLAMFLLLASAAPVRTDFKYTETSQVTGGALVGMVKFASVFSRGDAKKQEQQALQSTTTTHYLKSNRLRTDRPNGTAQIIDLEGLGVVEPGRRAASQSQFQFQSQRANRNNHAGELIFGFFSRRQPV